jgi:hypothetical protein
MATRSKSISLSAKPRGDSSAPGANGAPPEPITGTMTLKPAPGKLECGPHRSELVAVAAFYLAERRGFAPGHEVEDWLMAEAQFDVVPVSMFYPPNATTI